MADTVQLWPHDTITPEQYHTEALATLNPDMPTSFNGAVYETLVEALELQHRVGLYLDTLKKMTYQKAPYNHAELWRLWLDVTSMVNHTAPHKPEASEFTNKISYGETLAINAAIGSAGEAGELAEVVLQLLLKSEVNESRAKRLELVNKLISEGGDSCWYKQVLVRAVNQLTIELAGQMIPKICTFSGMLIGNINKLRKKHGQQFNPDFEKTQEVR